MAVENICRIAIRRSDVDVVSKGYTPPSYSTRLEGFATECFHRFKRNVKLFVFGLKFKRRSLIHR